MRKVKLPLGPAVIDVVGLALTDDDRKRLSHPAAGGVILFSRNLVSSGPHGNEAGIAIKK